jgi:hypothetical protein
MKPNVWKHSLILLAGLSVWAGCEPEEIDVEDKKVEVEEEASNYYIYDPNRILAENEIKQLTTQYNNYVFNYDNDNKLIKVDLIDREEPDGDPFYYEFTYQDGKLNSISEVDLYSYESTDENNNPITINKGNKSIKSYTYNLDGTIDKIEFVSYELETTGEWQETSTYSDVYEYNANKELSKVSYHENGSSEESTSYFEIEWENGNLKKKKYYDINQEGKVILEEEVEYQQYDNKKNPLSVIALLEDFDMDGLLVYATTNSNKLSKFYGVDSNDNLQLQYEVNIEIVYDDTERPYKWNCVINDLEDNDSWTREYTVTYRD